MKVWTVWFLLIYLLLDFHPELFISISSEAGPGVTQWLRRCATTRTVPGSIPGGVTGFFRDIFPSDRTMGLGSTQFLLKMSTRNIPEGKGGRCVRLTTCHEIWAPKPPGTLWATPGLLRESFIFYIQWSSSQPTSNCLEYGNHEFYTSG
jgi:hypothetical protein